VLPFFVSKVKRETDELLKGDFPGTDKDMTEIRMVKWFCLQEILR